MTREDFPLNIMAKQAAGIAAAELVQNGMLVGLGTGSTSAFFIDALGKRCREEKLNIHAIATSNQSKHQALTLNIPLLDDQEISALDITIDGADEIDAHKNMIKGGGGALLREKLLAQASKEMIVIVDENKLVSSLGSFPVPVEIASYIYKSTIHRLTDQGYHGLLRLNRDNTPYLTDNGNYIFDIQFEKAIVNPKKEHDRIRAITGVIETGLFFNLAGRIVVGYQDGLVKIHT